jgi:hypothetical protein
MFLYNKIGKGILHNIVHKLSVLSGSLRLLKNKDNEMQIHDSLPHRISTKSTEGFMEYMEHSVYGFYGNYAVLWINIAENRNCLTSFSRNLS